VIDVGCDPGGPWLGVGDAVKALRDEGLRVSIDSLDPREIAPAAGAGAELVLSVNSHNRHAAPDWGCEVVAIPDDPATLEGFDATIEYLEQRGVRYRLDPVIEPIGFGFAASLGRYLETRRRYPDAAMMMGIGNLTELTDVDSAGVNTLLLGFCQELGIRSVLTTEVIHWAQSSVRECDVGRRLMHYAVMERVLPKHLDSRLLMLRGETPVAPSAEEIEQLVAAIKDRNYRLFVSEGKVHIVAHDLHLAGDDAYQLWHQLAASGEGGTLPKNLDPSHAFYIGYEIHKAITALTLDKQYQQDEPLEWGFLTREETGHQHLRRDTDRGETPG
jgi:dihydropteroate synthase-like protein